MSSQRSDVPMSRHPWNLQGSAPFASGLRDFIISAGFDSITRFVSLSERPVARASPAKVRYP